MSAETFAPQRLRYWPCLPVMIIRCCPGFLWPAMAAASASAFAVAMAQEFIDLAAGPKAQQEPVEPAWATPGTVLLELDCVRLRGFGTATEGVATLICAPFALHAATITDIAPGHAWLRPCRQQRAVPCL
jgi:hypothetical protein